MPPIRKRVQRDPRTKGVAKATAARRAAADRATKKALDAGATGPHVLGFQRQARDIAIIAQLRAGVRPKDVAATFDLAERTVTLIRQQYRERSSAIEKLPMEIVEDLVRDYQALIADFQFAALRFSNNPAAYIAAKRQVRDTLNDFVVLMDALGKLPSNLETFVQAERLRSMARRMAEKMQQAVEGHTSLEEVRDFMLEVARDEDQAWEGRARQLPAAG